MLPPHDPVHTRRLRIFTPAVELPFAGHPTLGTAHVLASIGAIPLKQERTPIVFEEGVGPIPVTIFAQRNQPVFTQLTAALRPIIGPAPPDNVSLAAMLTLGNTDLLEGDYAPQAVSCGVPFLFVPLRNRDALKRARLDQARWQSVLADFWAPDLYLFTFDAELPDSQVRARMFAPSMGLAEDPATGAAASALGGYLGMRTAEATRSLRWIVEQGFEMGRPSLLEVEVDKVDHQLQTIRVGGASVLVSEGVMHIPREGI